MPPTLPVLIEQLPGPLGRRDCSDQRWPGLCSPRPASPPTGFSSDLPDRGVCVLVINRRFKDTALSLSGHEFPIIRGVQAKMRGYLCGSIRVYIGCEAGGQGTWILRSRLWGEVLVPFRGQANITPPCDQHAGTRLYMSAQHTVLLNPPERPM